MDAIFVFFLFGAVGMLGVPFRLWQLFSKRLRALRAGLSPRGNSLVRSGIGGLILAGLLWAIGVYLFASTIVSVFAAVATADGPTKIIWGPHCPVFCDLIAMVVTEDRPIKIIWGITAYEWFLVGFGFIYLVVELLLLPATVRQVKGFRRNSA